MDDLLKELTCRLPGAPFRPALDWEVSVDGASWTADEPHAPDEESYCIMRLTVAD